MSADPTRRMFLGSAAAAIATGWARARLKASEASVDRLYRPGPVPKE